MCFTGFRSSSACVDEVMMIVSLLCDLSAKSQRSQRFDFLLLRFFNLLILKRILEKVAVVVV